MSNSKQPPSSTSKQEKSSEEGLEKTVIYPGHDLNFSEQATVLHTDAPSFQNDQVDEQTSSVKIGQVLKNRFVIDSLIGIGGMGVVYKALDLRKKEAHDKEPFIAIKVLREDFKRHPESFIALQRESRKAQQLAHPNIVNVYDFDRDGEVVYMTMELLEGKGLDELLSYDYPNGLPIKQAVSVIKGTARALAYAHDNNIVHADFKPSNIFVCNDGRVKVFDFGIARAVKSAHEQDDDKTIFDAHSLGALTPTYASAEMLEGKEPVPQDDIYSLGCVSYIALTGKHPFRRKPANIARKERLSLERVKKLNKTQWRALQASCAFLREQRPQNVRDVANAFSERSRSNKVMLGGSILLGALIVFGGVWGYQTYERDLLMSAVAQMAQSGQSKALSNMLAQVQALDEKERKEILRALKPVLSTYFEKQVSKDLEGDDGGHQAKQTVLLAKTLYPDSVQLSQLETYISTHEFEILEKLTMRYQIALAQEALLETDVDSIVEVLHQVKDIRGDYYLLTDPELSDTYYRVANKALGRADFQQAFAYINQGLVFFPQDNKLIDLKDMTVIARYQAGLSREVESHKIDNIFSSTQALLTEYDRVLAAQYDQEDWFAQMMQLHHLITRKLGAGHAAVVKREDELMGVLFGRSQLMREQHRYSLANQYLQTIKTYRSDYPNLNDELQLLSASQSIYQVTLKRERSAHLLIKLKQQFDLAIEASDVVKGLNLYQLLLAELPERDSYMHDKARYKLETLLFSTIDNLIEDKIFNEAYLLLEQAKALMPENTTIDMKLEQINELSTEELRHKTQAILRDFQQGKQVDYAQTLIGLQHMIEQHDPKQAPHINAILKQQLLERFRLLKQQEAFDDLEKLHALLSALFPKDSAIQALHAKADACLTAFKQSSEKVIGMIGVSCTDAVNGEVGPELVVVHEAGNPTFAIGKYELSVGEFNQFCIATSLCEVSREQPDLPISDVSILLVKRYLAWLSVSTGYQYGLPTKSQWLKLSQQLKPSSQDNCRETSQGKVIRGQKVRSVQLGRVTQFGAVNVLGNVAEMVTSDGVLAAGGSFKTAGSLCGSASFAAASSGGATTLGVRVMRQLIK